MNFARKAGGQFAPKSQAADQPGDGLPSNPEASYGGVAPDTVAEAQAAPHGQAAEILERAQLILPEIIRVDLPDKNRTKAFWDKYDHLMKMETGDAFAVAEKQQSTWGYTIREVVKENEGRKYKFVRARAGLYLKRVA